MPDTRNIEPVHHQNLTDYHVHCDYSSDAEGTVQEYCEAALARGLAEICFTTHYDANPKSVGHTGKIRIAGEMKPVTPDNLAPYVDDVRRMTAEYLPLGLSVKLGVEFGWYRGCEEELERLKSRYSFDYILCGIHEVENVCFCCEKHAEECFSNLSPEQLAEKYFAQVREAARAKLFDTIAHLDYYKKYARKYYGEVIDRAHEPFVADAFAALKESGTALEVNTSGLRRGLGDYFPAVAIVNEAKDAGVDVVYLGSDAHKPQHIGYDFDAASALVPLVYGGCDD